MRKVLAFDSHGNWVDVSDGEVVVITVLDYVSQKDIVLRRVDLP